MIRQRNAAFINFEYHEAYRLTESEFLIELEKKGYTKIAFETVSLSMDQLNQMWSYLGSRYMPSILVKMRLVAIQNEDTNGDKVITNFRINLDDKDSIFSPTETLNHPPIP